MRFGDAASLTPWLSASHAQRWLEDAAREANEGPEAHSFEREVVLSLCFAEAFLFEYLRDYVFKGNWSALRDLLSTNVEGQPLWRISSFTRRWEAVCSLLRERERLTQRPELPEEFSTLIGFRHNLVHGNVVIPRDGREGDPRLAEPTPVTIRKLGRGWPTRTALIAARRLHEANARAVEPPEWLYGIEP